MSYFEEQWGYKSYLELAKAYAKNPQEFAEKMTPDGNCTQEECILAQDMGTGLAVAGTLILVTEELQKVVDELRNNHS